MPDDRDVLFEPDPPAGDRPRRRRSQRHRPASSRQVVPAALPFGSSDSDLVFPVRSSHGLQTWPLSRLEVWAFRLATFGWYQIYEYLRTVESPSRLEQISEERRARGNTSPAFPVDAKVLFEIERFASKDMSVDVVGEEVEKTLPNHVGHVIVDLDAPDGTLQALYLESGWAAVVNVYTIDTTGRRRWRCLVSVNAGGVVLVVDRHSVRRVDMLDFCALMAESRQSAGVVDTGAVEAVLQSTPAVAGHTHNRRTVAMNVVASKTDQLALLGPLQLALREFEQKAGVSVALVANQAGSPAADRALVPAGQLWWSRRPTRPCDSVPLIVSTHPTIGHAAWHIEGQRELTFDEVVATMEGTRPGDKSFEPYTIGPSMALAAALGDAVRHLL